MNQVTGNNSHGRQGKPAQLRLTGNGPSRGMYLAATVGSNQLLVQIKREPGNSIREERRLCLFANGAPRIKSLWADPNVSEHEFYHSLRDGFQIRPWKLMELLCFMPLFLLAGLIQGLPSRVVVSPDLQATGPCR